MRKKRLRSFRNDKEHGRLSTDCEKTLEQYESISGVYNKDTWVWQSKSATKKSQNISEGERLYTMALVCAELNPGRSRSRGQTALCDHLRSRDIYIQPQTLARRIRRFQRQHVSMAMGAIRRLIEQQYERFKYSVVMTKYADENERSKGFTPWDRIRFLKRQGSEMALNSNDREVVESLIALGEHFLAFDQNVS